jgi:hypothetical protein
MALKGFLNFEESPDVAHDVVVPLSEDLRHRYAGRQHFYAKAKAALR